MIDALTDNDRLEATTAREQRWIVAEAAVAALESCPADVVADVIRGYYPDASGATLGRAVNRVAAGMGMIARLVEQRRDRQVDRGDAKEPKHHA